MCVVCMLCVCVCVDFQSKLRPNFLFLLENLFANFAVFEVDMLAVDVTQTSGAAADAWLWWWLPQKAVADRRSRERAGRWGWLDLTNWANLTLQICAKSCRKVSSFFCSYFCWTKPCAVFFFLRGHRICISCQVITWWWATNKPLTSSRHQFKRRSN